MLFLGLGLVLVALKLMEIAPVVRWDWWQIIIPFVLAACWWAWADSSGYTKRKAAEREEERKRDRALRQHQSLHGGTGKPRR